MSNRSSNSEIEVDEPGTSTSTSSLGTLSTQNGTSDELFVRHKVSKLDTLAGLAIRYHVTVSDIKRANGLLSDTAMFARGTLLIPKKPLPVGAEYSTWAGMIVLQYGKLQAKERCPAQVGCDKYGGQRTSIDDLRGYYSTSPAASPKSNSDDDEVAGDMSEWHSSREVELMTRNVTGASTLYADERLRRRKQFEPGDPRDTGNSITDGVLSFLQRPFASAAKPRQQKSEHDVQRPPGKRKQSILERLKKVASLPALAAGPAPVTFSQAAEALLGSAGPGSTRKLDLSSARYSFPQDQATTTGLRSKESVKTD